MANFEEKFGDNDQYTVTLEIEPGETQGWVNGPDGYSASIAALEATGMLTNRHFEDMEVSQDDIDDIVEWAEENGY